MKKSIAERMTPLLTSELDEAVLTEQMLMDAVETADSILLANGLEVNADYLEGYLTGLEDVLENYELRRSDHRELQEIFRALVRGLGHVARGVGKTVGTYKKVKAAVGRAAAHVAGQYGSGHEAGTHSNAGPDEFETPAKKAKEPKKQSWFAKAAAAGAEKEKAKRAAKQNALATTPAGQHSAASAEALKAKQAAAASAEK